MKRVLLDTSAWLIHYLGERGSEKIQNYFLDSEIEIWICAISITEFSRRLSVSGISSEEVESVVKTYLSAFSGVVNVDTNLALSTWEIQKNCASRVPLIDLLIAASARSKEAILIHRDPHFKSLPLFFGGPEKQELI